MLCLCLVTLSLLYPVFPVLLYRVNRVDTSFILPADDFLHGSWLSTKASFSSTSATPSVVRVLGCSSYLTCHPLALLSDDFLSSSMGVLGFKNEYGFSKSCLSLFSHTLQYGPPYCSRCMPLLIVAYICLMYVHFYHSLCRTTSSCNPFFYILLCHTSNKVTVLLVLKLHSLLFSNFLVVVLASCMFLLFVLFCISGVFLEFSAGNYVPSVALSPQTAVSVFS